MSTKPLILSTESARRKVLLTLKKYSYLIAMLPLALPPLLLAAGQATGWVNLFAWGVPVVVFGIIPILDLLLGKDALNPDEEADTPRMNTELFYKFITLGWVAAFAVLLVWSMFVLASGLFNVAGGIGWIFSVGIVGGLGINVAHELIHKDGKLETWAGGFLLSLVSYAGFKVEHLRGHHVHVSTPEDASSSRYNQSLYNFLPQAYARNFINAWKLEAKRLEKKGHNALSWRNELIWWYSITALAFTAFTVAFGWLGAVFFLGQSSPSTCWRSSTTSNTTASTVASSKTAATNAPARNTAGTPTTSSPTSSCSTSNATATTTPGPNAATRSSATTK